MLESLKLPLLSAQQPVLSALLFALQPLCASPKASRHLLTTRAWTQVKLGLAMKAHTIEPHRMLPADTYRQRQIKASDQPSITLKERALSASARTAKTPHLTTVSADIPKNPAGDLHRSLDRSLRYPVIARDQRQGRHL